MLASGGFVVSDDVPGMNDLLDCSVPTYQSAEELRTLIDVYISDDAARERLAEKGQEDRIAIYVCSLLH